MDWQQIKVGLGVVVAAAAGVWGSVPLMVQVLLVLMALDLVSGLIAAYVTKTLDSAIGRTGLARKLMVWVVIAGGAAAQPLLGDVPVAAFIAGFYSLMELLSITEAAGRAGVPVPRFLSQAMVKLKDQFDSGTVVQR